MTDEIGELGREAVRQTLALEELKLGFRRALALYIDDREEAARQQVRDAAHRWSNAGVDKAVLRALGQSKWQNLGDSIWKVVEFLDAGQFEKAFHLVEQQAGRLHAAERAERDREELH